MICPHCAKQPMPFWRFLIHLNPHKIPCRHCHCTFCFNLTSLQLFYVAIISALPIGYSIGWLGDRFQLNFIQNSLVILVCLIGLAIPLEWYFWRSPKRLLELPTDQLKPAPA